jgi:hypothetical protein
MYPVLKNMKPGPMINHLALSDLAGGSLETIDFRMLATNLTQFFSAQILGHFRTS